MSKKGGNYAFDQIFRPRLGPFREGSCWRTALGHYAYIACIDHFDGTIAAYHKINENRPSFLIGHDKSGKAQDVTLNNDRGLTGHLFDLEEEFVPLELEEDNDT